MFFASGGYLLYPCECCDSLHAWMHRSYGDWVKAFETRSSRLSLRPVFVWWSRRSPSSCSKFSFVSSAGGVAFEGCYLVGIVLPTRWDLWIPVELLSLSRLLPLTFNLRAMMLLEASWYFLSSRVSSIGEILLLIWRRRRRRSLLLKEEGSKHLYGDLSSSSIKTELCCFILQVRKQGLGVDAKRSLGHPWSHLKPLSRVRKEPAIFHRLELLHKVTCISIAEGPHAAWRDCVMRNFLRQIGTPHSKQTSSCCFHTLSSANPFLIISFCLYFLSHLLISMIDSTRFGTWNSQCHTSCVPQISCFFSVRLIFKWCRS